LRIRLRFVNPQGQNGHDQRIKAGMFATIKLVTNSRINVPVIPRASSIISFGTWYAFIVDENNIAIRREIKLGLESEDLLEVLSGINPGDRVVIEGQNFLTDGDPVRILE
jgi:hypothetical protein